VALLAKHLASGMRGILFDKDGTLIDFDATWPRLYEMLALDLAGGDAALAEIMLAQGGFDPVTRRVRSGSTLAAGNTIDIARLWFPDLAPDPHRAMVTRIDTVFYENGIRYSVPVPGLAGTLAMLSAEGYAMGVATSDGTAGARAALEALGVAAHLPHVFGYDSVAHPKPAPDMVHAFAAAAGLALGEIVVVGDNNHDLAMARAAGAGAAIGVLTGNSSADDLAGLADAVLDSICDLPAWLGATVVAGKGSYGRV
jgi:phosphoglycolate phosphatase